MASPFAGIAETLEIPQTPMPIAVSVAIVLTRMADLSTAVSHLWRHLEIIGFAPFCRNNVASSCLLGVTSGQTAMSATGLLYLQHRTFTETSGISGKGQ
jgi:hypothetical protein